MFTARPPLAGSRFQVSGLSGLGFIGIHLTSSSPVFISPYLVCQQEMAGSHASLDTQTALFYADFTKEANNEFYDR